jgi:glycerol uptake facilitator-like aquaporin
MTLARYAVAEGVGTCLLLAAIVGSGIMGERLADGNVAVALLANTVATGAALVALILTFGPISGAHLNPVVTLANAARGGTRWRDTPAYLAAQLAGAMIGVAVANAMFDLPVLAVSQRPRTGSGQILGEFVATFGLLAVISGCSRLRSASVPFAVGAYITAADASRTRSPAFAPPTRLASWSRRHSVASRERGFSPGWSLRRPTDR